MTTYDPSRGLAILDVCACAPFSGLMRLKCSIWAAVSSTYLAGWCMGEACLGDLARNQATRKLKKRAPPQNVIRGSKVVIWNRADELASCLLSERPL